MYYYHSYYRSYWGGDHDGDVEESGCIITNCTYHYYYSTIIEQMVSSGVI